MLADEANFITTTGQYGDKVANPNRVEPKANRCCDNGVLFHGHRSHQESRPCSPGFRTCSDRSAPRASAESIRLLFQTTPGGEKQTESTQSVTVSFIGNQKHRHEGMATDTSLQRSTKASAAIPTGGATSADRGDGKQTTHEVKKTPKRETEHKKRPGVIHRLLQNSYRNPVPLGLNQPSHLLRGELKVTFSKSAATNQCIDDRATTTKQSSNSACKPTVSVVPHTLHRLSQLTAVGNSSPSPVYPVQLSRDLNSSVADPEEVAKLCSCSYGKTTTKS